MKARHHSFLRIFGLALFASASVQVAYSASTSWSATPTDANWATGANWASGSAPGTAAGGYGNGTRNNDVATFNQAVGTLGNSSNPILIDVNRFLKGITFDTASVGSYYIGTTGGSLLQLDQGGSITMNAAVTSSQYINAPIQIRAQSSFNPTYTLSNNATSSSATMNVGGNLNVNSSTGRGVNWVLSGSNTGLNTFSGSFTGSGSGGFTGLTKSGSGTWKLTNTNALPSVTVSDGTLIAAHTNALGTAATTVNGGTVVVENVALASSVVNLNSNGGIRGTGTAASVKAVAVNAAATNVGLSTGGSSDVFSVGLSSNSVSGGQASSVIGVSGPGTIHLGYASSYVGNWSVDQGTLRLGNAGALGSTSTTVGFGASSTGKLQLNGNSVTVGGLSSNATLGSPVIENGASGAVVLTVSGSGTSSFGGVIQDGAAGGLSLVKSGSGSLGLSGSNTFTGGVSVTAGTLKVNNSSGSATGTGNVTVGGTGTLGGSGSISALVDLQSGGTIAPGNSVGDLTLGSLTAASGSIFAFEFNNTPANDRIFVTNSNGLTLNGGGFNIFTEGSSLGYSTIGTYNLISYSGSIGGAGVSALSALNPVAGYNYTFGTSGGWVTLDIAAAGVISNWNQDSDGSWSSSGNWSAGVPSAAGDSANFTAAATAPRTITLDGGAVVGGISFDNASGYTIAQGSGGSLTLDGDGSQASVVTVSGSHVISSPVVMVSNTVSSVSAGASLTISGDVSGTASLTKSGAGSMTLTGSNSYSGGTSVTGGTLSFESGALGSGAIVVNGGNLVFAAGNSDDLSANGFSIGNSGVGIDTNGNNVSFSSSIGGGGTGGLVKTGAGNLSLLGANTYQGATVVNGGTLTINSNSSLGAPASGAGLSLNGATLVSTATASLDNAGANSRAVTIGAGGATITPASGTTLGITGTLTGSSQLTIAGEGTLTLAGSNNATFSGAIQLNSGSLALGGAQSNGQAGAGTGAITFGNGSALSMNGVGASDNGTSYGTLANALIVPSGVTASLSVPKRGAVSGTLTGSGTLNVQVEGNVSDFSGNWSAFSGQINLSGSGQFRLANFQNNIFNNAKLHIGSGVWVQQVFNPPTGTGTETVQNIGELSGDAGSILGGNPVGGRFVNWTVGGLNTNSTFSGTIQNDTDASNGFGEARLTKVGTGTLILDGNSTFTGATTVSAGTLLVNGSLGNTAVSVNNGATLGGTNGTIGTGTASVTINNGGTFSPGSSPGSMTINGSTTLNAGSTFEFEYTGGGGGASTDLVDVNGTLTLNGATLSLIDLGSYLMGDKFTLFAYDSMTGAFAGLSDDSIFNSNGGDWLINYDDTTPGLNGGSGAGYVTLTAVPEPGSALLGGLGVLALLRRRRK